MIFNYHTLVVKGNVKCQMSINKTFGLIMRLNIYLAPGHTVPNYKDILYITIQ